MYDATLPSIYVAQRGGKRNGKEEREWNHSTSANNSAELRAVMEAYGAYFLWRGSNLLWSMWLRQHPAVSKIQRKMGKTHGPLGAIRPSPEPSPTL